MGVAVVVLVVVVAAVVVVIVVVGFVLVVDVAVVVVVVVAVAVIVCGVPSSVILVTIVVCVLVVVVEISLFSAKKSVRIGMVTMARPAKIKKITVAIPIFSIGPIFQDITNTGSSLSVVETLDANDTPSLNLEAMYTVTNRTYVHGRL